MNNKKGAANALGDNHSASADISDTGDNTKQTRRTDNQETKGRNFFGGRLRIELAAPRAGTEASPQKGHQTADKPAKVSQAKKGGRRTVHKNIITTLLPASLRSSATEDRYQNDKVLGLTGRSLLESEVMESFKYWLIIDNAYPYDMAFNECHMLIPRREVGKRSDLTLAEFEELQDILQHYVEPLYDLIMENTANRRSILNHYHLHLLSYHEDRGAMAI